MAYRKRYSNKWGERLLSQLLEHVSNVTNLTLHGLTGVKVQSIANESHQRVVIEPRPPARNSRELSAILLLLFTVKLKTV